MHAKNAALFFCAVQIMPVLETEFPFGPLLIERTYMNKVVYKLLRDNRITLIAHTDNPEFYRAN